MRTFGLATLLGTLLLLGCGPTEYYAEARVRPGATTQAATLHDQIVQMRADIYKDLAEQATTIQDFEGKVELNPYPADAKVELTGVWSTDGKQALHLGGGAMIGLDQMKEHDWSGYQYLRFHVCVPDPAGIILNLEIWDDQKENLNRHRDFASAGPGESVVQVDISGDLWRGLINKPYRLLKTPVDKSKITRLAIAAEGSDVYIDQIELVKVAAPRLPGAFAFDFGRAAQPTQVFWTPINPDSKWDETKGYGLTPGATVMNKTMPHPTPVMGDGVTLGKARFEVRLPAGKFRGWYVLERSGFTEDDQAVYRKAALTVNGRSVSSHRAEPDETLFKFQDLEVLTQKELVGMVMARQGADDFTFDAIDGKNAFTLAVEGAPRPDRGTFGGPPRLAGLVIAPDTEAGKAYVEMIKKQQLDTVASVHRILGRQNRLGDPAKAKEPLLIMPLPTEAVMNPGDWPAGDASQPIPTMHGFPAMPAARLIGLYAARDMTITAELPALVNGTETLPPEAIHLLSNVYLPIRDYDVTACTIQTHHYRPMRGMTAGPNLARSLAIMVDVPADAKPGTYTGNLLLTCVDKATGAKMPVLVPISVQVHDVGAYYDFSTQIGLAASLGVPQTQAERDWPPVISPTMRDRPLPLRPIPIGPFFSGVPVPKEIVGDAIYWRLTEDLLRQMRRASFNMLTGGPDYSVTWEGDVPTYHGDDAVRLIRLAHNYGLDKVVAGYGGFNLALYDVNTRDLAAHDKMTLQQTYAALGKAWESFRTANDLPVHYFSAYDEPGTAAEFAPLAARLKILRDSGFKTLGFTSVSDHEPLDDNRKMLLTLTAAPCLRRHSAETNEFIRKQGNEPWTYTHGLTRSAMGVGLWQNKQAGIAGRFEWIGSIVQGYQYDTLDSREPDPSMFYLHKTLGALVSPRFFGALEGGIDARLIFEIERRAKGPDSPAAHKMQMVLKDLAAKPYLKPIPWDELEGLRVKMIGLMEESVGK